MRRLEEDEADFGVIRVADLPDIFNEEVPSIRARTIDDVLRSLLPRIIYVIIR